MRFLSLILILLSTVSYGQNRCAVEENYFNQRFESDKKFEQWLSDLRTIRKLRALAETQVVYQIPVVFHVIHNGEALGDGSNIPDERIIQQVQILNEDFRKLNADTAATPEVFKAIAADIEIEFVLAKRDPEGLPTDGIVRKRGSKTGYTLSSDDETLKAESYWPAEDYLNFYVAELTGFLGWAQFPYSNLEGVEEIKSDRLTDGIAIDYQYVGINENTGGSFESYGRTASHEIGHYFGLRHPWGDISGCSGTDYCEDTPVQADDYADSCPGTLQESCGSPDMYSNYMNYTDDACMNIFTFDQKERMRIILENAPRRKSLISSPALNEPIQVSDDLGIRKIITPSLSGCVAGFTPTIEIRNYGINTIQNYEVSYRINGELIESISRNISLGPLETTIVNFSELNDIGDQEVTFRFSVTSVNSSNDNNGENDEKSIVIPPLSLSTLPFNVNFENSDNITTRTLSGNPSNWTVKQAPYFKVDNNALSIDLSDPDHYGEYDYFLTPTFDLSALNSAEFGFSYAYSGNGDIWNKDGFIVAVSTDCGESFPTDQYIFERYAGGLATATPSTEPFTPGTPSDWTRETFNLSRFTGNDNVRIAFIGLNNGGNTLYLDSISFISTALKAYDLGISAIANFPVVTCQNNIQVDIDVKNFGFEEVNSFSLEYSSAGINNEFIETDLNLLSGDVLTLSFSISNLNESQYEFVFQVKDPNGLPDEEISNDIINQRIIIDNAQDILPLREDFQSENNWIISSPTGTPLISQEAIDQNQSIKINAFEGTELGTQHWLVSPILNTSEFDSMGVFFNYAYRSRGGATDRLQVLISNNCGRTYDFLVYDKPSSELNNELLNTDFVPQEEDWQQDFIDLTEFNQWSDIRLAWVFTNGNGNNLYLDNIEFSNIRKPELLQLDNVISLFPNPAVDQSFSMVLDLNERQDVNISMVDMTGKIITQFDYPNALNQIISFKTPNQSGFYMIRVIGPRVQASERLFVRR